MEILKRPIGKQDHYAAAFGSINFFKFNSDDSVSIKPVDETSRYTKMIFESLITFILIKIEMPQKFYLIKKKDQNK
jgi:D-glycero-alpha-D-manno-heptose-7-phosphate kinase